MRNFVLNVRDTNDNTEKERDDTIPLKNTNHCRSFSKNAFLSTSTQFFETVTSTAHSVNA